MKKTYHFCLFLRPAMVSLLICGALLLISPQKSSGYDNDTHFWLTYYLAIKAGYTTAQAESIASADISVDLDTDTSPLLPEINNVSGLIHPLTHFQKVRANLHALPRRKDIYAQIKRTPHYWWNPYKVTDSEILKISDDFVNNRKNQFWNETLTEGKNPGVFLHYLQDSFSHQGFLSYIGHAGYFYVDFLDTDPVKAEEMAFETLRYLIAFREKNLNNKNLEPKTIELAAYLKDDDVTQIKQTVKKFCEANPNEKKAIQPNVLIETWDTKLSEADRKEKHRILPLPYVSALNRVRTDNPSTDSCKAREVVKNALNYQEPALPKIWQFNLNERGKAKKDLTDKFVVLCNSEQKQSNRAEIDFRIFDEKPRK